MYSLGVSGTKAHRLKETGAAEEIADLQTIPINRGMYNPAEKTYNTGVTFPSTMNQIRLISVVTQGNLHILDSAGTLWRANMFE